ncbi:TrmB family transcriptional regulator [Nanoarchaeota archaeon]
MSEKLLEQAGLTNSEAKIYLALLELGSSLAGAITRKTGVHRRSVYDAIERLIQKGLVSYIKKNNLKYFESVNPQRLLDIVKEKEDNIKEFLPELEKKFNFVHKKEETLFFRGKQALKTVFDDQIKEGKEILIFGASSNANEIVKYYFPRYDRERINKKIKIKAIFNEKLKKKPALAEIKYLPKEYHSHTATNVYGNKVAIILWSEEPFAILINQKEIADSYRNYFELMWKLAKK